MLVRTGQSSSRLSACLRVVSATVVACLLSTFQHAIVEAQDQTLVKPQGRIYVSASYRLMPEAEAEEKTAFTAFNSIIAVDPATGSWQLIVEKGNAPRLSPDRRTLVFNRLDDGIWKCESDGQFPFRISNQSGRPVWSADGKHLVVTKEELIDKDSEEPSTAPVWHDETWRLDPDGGNTIKLPIPDTDAVADWSADGQWFVVTTDRHPPYGSGYQLYVMKTDGTQQRRLTQGGLNVYARFSPDGKKILYHHQTRAEGSSIWTVGLDGENATEIVKEVGLASPDFACWSPDGKQIAVILFDWQLDDNGRKFLGNPDAANFRIEVMDVDGTNRRQLTLQGAKLRYVNALGDWR